MAAALVVALATLDAQVATPAREPASKAAAILTWPVAQREQYIAALDTFFLTRTVQAGTQVRALERGRPLAAFEAGGRRADDFARLLDAERIRGVLVLHDGKVRLERYVAPHGPATRWNSFSVAKSVTSTLVGAAIKDGHIQSLDDPVTRYIRALRGSAYDDVTVRQLLTMTSGVKWNEDYTDLNSDVARMYALAPDPGFDMTVSYVRKLPREAPPGSKWVYKTSETNLVGVLVAEATGRPLADYLSEKIWRPYGMERDAEWMIDDVGHEQGGCCLAMTLRDYGRFGQFVLDGALIDGKSIVADGWLQEATRSHVSTGGGGGYGYQWWTREDGTFEGRGIYGQTLHIDRARRLVIVINSATENPTGRASGQARQALIAAIEAELDAEKAPVVAQADAPPISPRFEVVSIKQTSAPPEALSYLLPLMVTSCGLPGLDRAGTGVVIRSASLCGLIRLAYNVSDHQVADIPPLFAKADPSNLFAIEARTGSGPESSIDDIRRMLQAMLVERFGLRVHREPREISVYALTVMKGGPKWTPCSNPAAPSSYTPGRIASCTPPMGMARVVQMLSREAGRPVIDKTGLTDTYAFELRWQPDNAAVLPDSLPSLFTAVQEQLGLKLEAARSAVDSIVIDHAEAPTPN